MKISSGIILWVLIAIGIGITVGFFLGEDFGNNAEQLQQQAELRHKLELQSQEIQKIRTDLAKERVAHDKEIERSRQRYDSIEQFYKKREQKLQADKERIKKLTVKQLQEEGDSIYIANIQSVPNSDSSVVYKKPVAEFLISEHYRASSLQEDKNNLTDQLFEVKYESALLQKKVESLKKDSVQADLQLGIAKRESQSWKESSELEKKNSKKKLTGWKLISGGLAILLVLIASN